MLPLIKLFYYEERRGSSESAHFIVTVLCFQADVLRVAEA